MIRLLLKSTLLISVLLALVVVVIRAAPYDDERLALFMHTQANCEDSCLLGIQPGRTTVSEAMALLEESPWVDIARMSAPGTGFAQIRWDWSGQQPALINDAVPGRITFYWDREDRNAPSLEDTAIDEIAIHTHLRMQALQDWFGPADSGTANFRPDLDLGYSAVYHKWRTTVQLSTIMPCPVNWRSYWDARTRIAISVWRGTSEYVPPVDMLKLC